MNNTTRFSKRTLHGAIVAMLMFAVLQTIAQPAAHALDCTGTVAERTAGIECDRGNGGSGNIDVDPGWVVIRDSGVPCMYNGTIPSYIGDIQNLTTGEIVTNYCIAQAAGTANISGFARQAVKAPTPETDYKTGFLTGAEVHFTAPALRDYSVDVPNFPGVKLIITTMDVTWDFGDGTTSKDLEPTHTYESISPNQQQKDQHSVHVAITATWKVNVMDPTTGTTQDLGTFSDTGALDRSLVQVWSKQTEPNS